MRRVSVIKGKALIGSQQRAQRRPPYRFTFPLQPLRLNLTCPCCCYTYSAPPTAALAACVLFTLLSLLSRSIGEHPTSELAFDGGLYDVGGGGGGGSPVRWESPISSGGRAFWSAGLRCVFPAPSSVSVSLCFPTAPARLHAWQTDRCYLACISSSGPLSLSTNSPLLPHRLQISPASLPLDKGQYQWQNIFYVWNVAHNKQSSIRFV